jgi:thiamine biosynthesis lipoprotein ApbE
VVASTGTASDALSTTLLLVGPEKGKELVQTVAGVAAVWISADGRSELASSGPQILINGNAQRPAASARTGSGGLR